MGVRLEVLTKNSLNFDVNDDFVTRRAINVYNIDDDTLSAEDLKLIQQILEDPLVEQTSIDHPVLDMLSKISNPELYHMIDVKPRPGVTDSWGDKAKEVIERVIGREIGGVSHSRQYVYKGNLDDEQMWGVKKKLANEISFLFEVKKGSEWNDEEGAGFHFPKYPAQDPHPFEYVDLGDTDDRLIEISHKRMLGLSLDEMKSIRELFTHDEYEKFREDRVAKGMEANKITDAELEDLAQSWSDHCKHKKFNARWEYTTDDQNDRSGIEPVTDSIFKTFIKGPTERIKERIKEKGDWIVSVFDDNAGVIRLTWDKLAEKVYNVATKVETHNHPSGVEPFGGANTGVGGVIRDPTCTGIGMEPVSLQEGYRVGELDNTIDHKTGFLRAWELLDGMIKGVIDYGNKIGIPTRIGTLFYNNGWIKPGMFAGCTAVAPAEINGRLTHEKKVEEDYIAITVGGGVGRDGIHGATASSKELSAEDDIDDLGQTVQIGDPIEEKKVLDVMKILRDAGLIEASQDCGAGGWNSAVGELAELCNGAVMDLTNAPIKYKGLMSWEKLVSEAQERVVLVIKPENYDKVMEICNHYKVNADKIANFNKTGYYEVKDQDKTAVFLPMKFRTQGLPEMTIKAHWTPPEEKIINIISTEDLKDDLLNLIGTPNLQSYHSIRKRYDRQVQGGSIIDCMVGLGEGKSDAVMYKPILSESEVLIECHGSNPWQGDIDGYEMGRNNVVDAIGKIIAVGGDLRRIAFNDNTITPKPEDDPHIAAKVIRMIKGAADATEYFNTPMISGKDSTSMEVHMGDDKIIKSKPELLMSAVGVMPNDSTKVTSDYKIGGDLIYVVGETKDELGGSELFNMKDHDGTNIPTSDFDEIKGNYKSVINATQKGLIHSAQYLSRGGLFEALANGAIGGDLGFNIKLDSIIEDSTDAENLDPLKVLTSESTGRFLVTVHRSQQEAFEKAMGNTYHKEIGLVSDYTNSFIHHKDEVIFQANSDELKEARKGKIDTNNLREWVA